MAFISSLYFFVRHNAYCEPGIYSLFATAEYVVVVTNVAFHATVYYDLNDKSLAVLAMSPMDWKATWSRWRFTISSAVTKV